MTNSDDSLQTLAEIRDMMARSSKFISLSGLSGISAGVAALVGALVAYMRFNTDAFNYATGNIVPFNTRREMLEFILLDGACVLAVAIAFGVFFTMRKARRSGHAVWNTISKRLLISLFIPLVAGGLFCIALFYRDLLWVCFPATLVFYGLALINASKYTLRDVEYLGMFEIALGLISLFVVGYNLLFWAIGFGLLHIIYGASMYFKYDIKR